MESKFIEGTPRTPEIALNVESGTLKISGRSIPENSVSFYQPVFDWLDDYAKKPSDNITMVFELEYFNTASSKCILDVLRKLEHIKNLPSKPNVVIKWLFEEGDEDIEEAGGDFGSLVNIDIDIEVKK